jgi:hypothetical protein
VKGTNIDYSEFLGPDWIADWDQAPIVIGGPHCSCLENALAVYSYFPSFIARISISKMYLIGAMANALNCIYIDRFGKNAKESSKQTI